MVAFLVSMEEAAVVQTVTSRVLVPLASKAQPVNKVVVMHLCLCANAS